MAESLAMISSQSLVDHSFGIADFHPLLHSPKHL